MHRLYRRLRDRPALPGGRVDRGAAARAAPGATRVFAAALALLCGLMLAGPAAVRAAEKPLIFGVFPKLTARQTVTVYLPLAKSMEKQLGRPVAIYSARDFETFVEHTARGEYDILLTAPHLAWLAHQDAGYAPLMKYAEPTRGLLVVADASAYRRPEEMRGRTIATADAIAVTVLAAEAELAARGIERRIDYQTRDAGTHLNAVMQVINGRADAAMLGLHPYLLLPPEVRARLRILVETGPVSSLMYLTHPRLRARDTEAVRRGILAFAATAEGARFLRHGGYGNFVAADASELPALQPYALQAQEMLRARR